MLKILQKSLGLLITTAFVAVFFCMSTGDSLDKDGQTSCCMSTYAHSSTHLMDLDEHIQHWKQIFTATQPSLNNPLSLLSIILISLGFGTFILKFTNFEITISPFSAKLYKERNAIAKLFDPILRALSNGILNPKLYDLSSIIR